MDYGHRQYTARQLLATLERDVVLRGRLPKFSELAYRSDGPSVETYLDLLGEGDWFSLQVGLSAWLSAHGYLLDNEGQLVSKLPPPPTPPPVAEKPPSSGEAQGPMSARELRAAAERERKKAKSQPRKQPGMPDVANERDWTRAELPTLVEACHRVIERRFPSASAKGQQLIGSKLVTALASLIQGQAFSFDDGRHLVRTLTALLFPEALTNQLCVHPLFWRDDPLGGLIAQANGVLYPERDLITVAETVDLLQLDYLELVDRLSHNELTLIFTRSYAFSRAEVATILARQRRDEGGDALA